LIQIRLRRSKIRRFEFRASGLGLSIPFKTWKYERKTLNRHEA
jgi:hypothetical protein